MDGTLEQLIEKAKQGDDAAQHELGARYFYGEGVEQSYELAAKWIAMAAEQGDGTSQDSYGVILEGGYGVKQDYISAAFWYLKSAEQDNETGTENLIKLYNTGLVNLWDLASKFGIIVHEMYLRLDAAGVDASKKQKALNNYARWTDEEDRQLVSEWVNNELPLDKIAELHSRGLGAISARLQKLELIEDWQNPPQYYAHFEKHDDTFEHDNTVFEQEFRYLRDRVLDSHTRIYFYGDYFPYWHYRNLGLQGQLRDFDDRILDLKHNRDNAISEFADLFREKLGKLAGQFLVCIVPSSEKGKTSGVMVVAELLCKYSNGNLIDATDCIIRNRTKQKSQENRGEDLNTLGFVREELRGKDIILFDDVTTSQSSFIEISKTLVSAWCGAKSCTCIAIGRTVRNDYYDDLPSGNSYNKIYDDLYPTNAEFNYRAPTREPLEQRATFIQSTLQDVFPATLSGFSADCDDDRPF